MEDQITVEVERKIKKMALGTQTVAQVQPVQPIQEVSCEICGGAHFTMHCVATAQQVEEINFLKQNNPYSNTHNPGWKNHPNFSWKDQQGNVQKQVPNQYQSQPQQQYRPQQQQPYQQQFHQPQQQFQQQVPRKADWELSIKKMAAQSSQFQEETRSNLRNIGASIKNLEVQMSQIAQ
ncbi:50 kDa gamma-zein-like [Lathyrus oleraceus]|uniref:50 kDa gamma-zein-like n=1 Tax=Pisum sativum TaxID=3888 RepID=UPI0021CE147F|nr:50 kDa gamma-zein-like [Pisum sativum]